MIVPLRILVFGGSGQVASALQARCAQSQDAALVCAGRPDVDLTDRGSLAVAMAEARPDVVINTAAYTQVDTAETERELALAVNCTGARWVAELTAEHDVPVIHLSTDCVFSGHGARPQTEEEPARPVNWYGETKLRGEREVAQSNPAHLIVRTAWVHAPGGSGFTQTMLRLAAERDVINVVEDQVGAPTRAADLSGALLALARKVAGLTPRDRVWGVYHLTNAGETSRAEWARAIFETSARFGGPSAEVRPIPTSRFPTAAARPRNSRLDCSRIRDGFGIVLPDWRQGVDATVRAELRP